MITTEAGSPSAPPAVSVDAFLGGRVEAVQPEKGHHRAGLEAVLLAASLDARISGTVVDLGAGAGVAGLCAGHAVQTPSTVWVATGRISTAPHCTGGACPAQPKAASRSGTSTMKTPPSCSLVSAKGPS